LRKRWHFGWQGAADAKLKHAIGLGHPAFRLCRADDGRENSDRCRGKSTKRNRMDSPSSRSWTARQAESKPVRHCVPPSRRQTAVGEALSRGFRKGADVNTCSASFVSQKIWAGAASFKFIMFTIFLLNGKYDANLRCRPLSDTG
jgi:hypothetical protein